jgi:hypothetical protein
MSDMTLKADQERPGRTQPSDIAWAAGYVIVTILPMTCGRFRGTLRLL